MWKHEIYEDLVPIIAAQKGYRCPGDVMWGVGLFVLEIEMLFFEQPGCMFGDRAKVSKRTDVYEGGDGES